MSGSLHTLVSASYTVTRVNIPTEYKITLPHSNLEHMACSLASHSLFAGEHAHARRPLRKCWSAQKALQPWPQHGWLWGLPCCRYQLSAPCQSVYCSHAELCS